MADPHAHDRSATTTIAAPPAVVFAILADPRQHARIDGSGTVRGAVTGPERLELGSEFAMGMRKGAGYTMTNRVVEHEPDRLIAWRHVGAHRWRYELVPTTTADGREATTVTETWDLSAYPAPARLALAAVFGRGTQRAVEATLARLRSAAEDDVRRRG